MTTITVTLTSICTGGNHLTFSIAGAKAAVVPATLSDLSSPITEDDAEAFCKIIARLVKSGRTVAQARTMLQNGVTVTV